MVHRRFQLLAMWVLAGAATWAQTSVSANGWTVEADSHNRVVSVAYQGLGPVMHTVRLNLATDRGLTPFASWTAERKAPNQLSIRTAQPHTAWLFELRADGLKISSTSLGAVLSGIAPAPQDRIVARLLDREGAPVIWQGTEEVIGSYGGAKTQNQSYLPRHNPEVMYFSLGQVPGSLFHGLFDRKSGTAIQFPESTTMRRNAGHQDLLDVTLPVAGNARILAYPDYFTKELGVPFYVPFDDTYFKTAPSVWSSWTSYYAEVTENDMVRNADWIAENLKPYGFEYVELDDGYDRGKREGHYWIENWNQTRFPHGPEWLTAHIRSKGLRAGIWLVPNSYAGAVQEHPDWYLRDKQGKIIQDYATPALDSSNPQVIEFVKKIFTTLDSWGFEYYKLDGEHAMPKYVPAADRDKLYDKVTDPIVTYRERLEAIRSVIGPKTFVEVCPAGTPLNGIGFFNSYFNGQDQYANWQGSYPLFSSISANAFLNHLLVYVMPGEGMELTPHMSVEEATQRRRRSVMQTARSREDPLTGIGTTLAEARSIVSFVALSGAAYPLASVMPEVPPERLELLRKTLPTTPIVPIDLFSRGNDIEWDTFKHTTPDDYIHNYPEIMDLKVNGNSGAYDVVGLTNWRSEPITRVVSLTAKLGLAAGPYVVFDFWNQKELGVFQGEVKAEIAPHDTRVLAIHPLAGHPQLIGLSRHITGAYSISDLAWNEAARTLRGRSASVPGDPYSLWLHVPSNTRISRARAMSGQAEISAVTRQVGNSLTVSFTSPQERVDWEVSFSGK